uniref:Uncharacterized protein n=1 Tax=Anguilla anguilla TaxID=7936 RepID=A0A0E9XLP1_ANGAN
MWASLTNAISMGKEEIMLSWCKHSVGGCNLRGIEVLCAGVSVSLWHKAMSTV